MQVLFQLDDTIFSAIMVRLAGQIGRWLRMGHSVMMKALHLSPCQCQMSLVTITAVRHNESDDLLLRLAGGAITG
jgi:hypothetical protein